MHKTTTVDTALFGGLLVAALAWLAGSALTGALPESGAAMSAAVARPTMSAVQSESECVATTVVRKAGADSLGTSRG